MTSVRSPANSPKRRKAFASASSPGGSALALIDEDPRAFFTTAHFDGYATILIALDQVDPERLREVVTDAWLARPPKRLAADFLASGRT